MKYTKQITVTGKNSGNNESKSSQLKSRAIRFHRSDKETGDLLNNSNININAINQNNDIELPVNDNDSDRNEKQCEVSDLAKSISWLSFV